MRGFKVSAGKEENVYIDCHNDTILKVIHGGEDFAHGSPNLQIDLPKILAVPKLGALFFAAWCDPIYKGSLAVTKSIEMLRRIRELAQGNSEHLEIARSMSDVGRIAGHGKVSVLLAVEGGQPINDDTRNIERLYGEGVRLITFCHLVSPDWVGGSHDNERRGLTGFGVEVVRAMNEIGMIVDVAHASEQSILDIAAVSSAPILSSHSCVKGVFDTKRALSDMAIRAIAATGGAVAIMFFPAFLAQEPQVEGDPVAKIGELFSRIDRDISLTVDEKAKRKLDLICREYPKPPEVPSLEAIFRHIDYAVRLAGDDHVAIGSDFDGIPYSCAGLEDIGKLEALVDLMRRHGYTEKRVDKIMGENVIRVMGRAIR